MKLTSTPPYLVSSWNVALLTETIGWAVLDVREGTGAAVVDLGLLGQPTDGSHVERVHR